MPTTNYTGQDDQGRITTMGRGGSDLTATVIGSAAQVDEIQVGDHHSLSFGCLKCYSMFLLLFVNFVLIQYCESLANVCFIEDCVT